MLETRVLTGPGSSRPASSVPTASIGLPLGAERALDGQLRNAIATTNPAFTTSMNENHGLNQTTISPNETVRPPIAVGRHHAACPHRPTAAAASNAAATSATPRARDGVVPNSHELAASNGAFGAVLAGVAQIATWIAACANKNAMAMNRSTSNTSGRGSVTFVIALRRGPARDVRRDARDLDAGSPSPSGTGRRRRARTSWRDPWTTRTGPRRSRNGPRARAEGGRGAPAPGTTAPRARGRR